MLNELRIDELKSEIRKIKQEQEEADDFFVKLMREEEKIHEEIQEDIRQLGVSFDASRGDSRWTALVEERYSILMSADQYYTTSADELIEDRKAVNRKCKSDIEELELEIQKLGGELL